MPGDMYMWMKAFHVIAIIAWMAGMLYLPRLYVYHAQVKVGSEASELFKVMEHRLLRYIINPAMIVAWCLGLWLAFKLNAFAPANGLWMHYKLTLLFFMQIVHALLARHRRQFAKDENKKSAKYFKILNESVTVLMIGIVILVVVRPV